MNFEYFIFLTDLTFRFLFLDTHSKELVLFSESIWDGHCEGVSIVSLPRIFSVYLKYGSNDLSLVFCYKCVQAF